MPTYEYACTECDHTFEQVQSFSDTSLTTCPDCGGALRKIYGAVGVVFKGAGFYRTDSRKAESASTPALAGKSEGKSEGKADAKSEGKAAGKSDSTTPAKKDPSGTPSSTPTPAAPAKGPSTKTKSSTGGSSTS